MTPNDFQSLATSDPRLSDFLKQVARSSALTTEPHNFATGLEPVVIWACYVLFRWSKMVLDARQRELELDATRQQTRLIRELVDEGWPREQAQALVPALLDGLDKRQKDEAFQNALGRVIESVASS